MTQLTSAKLVAAAALVVVSSTTTAAPAAAETATLGSAMPLSSHWRACDFTKLKWVHAVGDARPVAHVGTAGPSTVVATVDVFTALPNTRYDVRVIQTPRPSQGCAAGAGGVVTGSVQTDAVGAGSTTVAGPIANGATGAWVVLERPSGNSQTPAEFYTSEFIASI